MSKQYRVLELECVAFPSSDGVLITMTSDEDEKSIRVTLSGRNRSFTMTKEDIVSLRKFLDVSYYDPEVKRDVLDDFETMKALS